MPQMYTNTFLLLYPVCVAKHHFLCAGAIRRYHDHYNYIKSVIRTKKPKPNTKGDLLEMLNDVIKSLLGRKIIKSKEIIAIHDLPF